MELLKKVLDLSLWWGNMFKKKVAKKKNWMLIAQVTVSRCLANRADIVPGSWSFLFYFSQHFQAWQ